MPLDISIPNTTVSSTAKPFTIYNISIRQPLRTLTLAKRYTDFVKLHDTLTSQTGAPPPAPLPGKSWFSRTVNNPQLTEQRRVALEAYLRAIENDPDPRWRHSSAWRTFLDLGTSGQRKSEGSSAAAGAGVGGGVSVRDAATWLSVFQELKGQLHAARVALTRREQAQSAQAQHEAGAAAKKGLVLAGTLIAALDEGLRVLGGGAESNGNGRKKGGGNQHQRGFSDDMFPYGDKLGEGELRRRRDLIASARKEKEGLEGVLSAMVMKSISTANAPSSSTSSTAGAAANPADKAHLFHNGNGSSTTTATTSRRTLGAPQETARTRELDNSGVLQLQKQIMHEQDEDVVDLTKALRRMREMGVQINDELQLQNEMLRMLDDDVERVGGKIDIAKNRIKKIS